MQTITTKKLSLSEKLILILVTLVLLCSFLLLYTNRPAFDRYVAEDNIVEWLTILGLLLGSFVCFARFIKFLRKRSWMFLAITFLLGLMLFVVAGEEISWGQRLLGIEASEYFQKNNLQKETNFHNLVVNGVKINKVVFSIGLIAVLAVYLLLFPLLYRKNTGFKKWIDSWGIVLPQNYQLVAFLLLFIIASLIQHERNPEVLECGTTLLFFLIVRFPLNAHIFNSNTGRLRN